MRGCVHEYAGIRGRGSLRGAANPRATASLGNMNYDLSVLLDPTVVDEAKLQIALSETCKRRACQPRNDRVEPAVELATIPGVDEGALASFEAAVEEAAAEEEESAGGSASSPPPPPQPPRVLVDDDSGAGAATCQGGRRGGGGHSGGSGLAAATGRAVSVFSP